MYKRTFWIDDVEGIQEGTPLNADNFNNLEGGAMEAGALAALISAYHRANEDKVYPVKQGGTGADNAAGARKNLGISGVVTGTYVGTGAGKVTVDTSKSYGSVDIRTYTVTGENIIPLPFTPSAVMLFAGISANWHGAKIIENPYLITGGDIRGKTTRYDQSGGDGDHVYNASGFIVENGFAVVKNIVYADGSTISDYNLNTSGATYRYIAFE